VSIRAVAAVLDLCPPSLPPTARLVAVVLADHVNDETRYCYPSVTTLQRRTGLSRASIFRALTDLEVHAVIERVPRFVDNRQTTSGYLWNLLPDLPGGVSHRDPRPSQPETPGGLTVRPPGVSQ
jgi:hypothetical protein